MRKRKISSNMKPNESTMNIDEHFRDTLQGLIDTQDKLNALLKELQVNHPSVNATRVADATKAVAEAVAEMNSMARDWAEEAAEARQERAEQRTALPEMHLYREPLLTEQQLRERMEFSFAKFLSDLS